MKLGIATSDGPVSEVLARVGALKPAYVAMWWRLGQRIPRRADLDAIAERGAVPVVFFESAHGRGSPSRYPDILRGDWDPSFGQFAEHAASFGPLRVILRIDPEINGSMYPWRDEPPARYIAAFTHISETVRRIAPNVEAMYCPVARGRKRQKEITAYYPGAGCQTVGFDFYSTRPDPRFPPRNWRVRGTMETLRKTGKPIIVAETARLRGTGSRVPWLRSWAEVPGLEGVIYFDVPEVAERESMIAGLPRDWTMGGSMRRAFNEVNC